MAKILVIDDEAPLIELLSLALKRAGHETCGADNGMTGLEMILEYKPDLIICDIMMPELTGYEILSSVRKDKRFEHFRAIPFIFLSAKRTIEDVLRGKELGVEDYVTKPVNPRDLVSIVDARLNRYSEIRATIEHELLHPQLKHHIFLSYAHKDTESMQLVRTYCDGQGLRVWNDEQLTPGTPAWTKAIEEAIEQSDCVVVILSPDAKHSVWVDRELSHAAIHKIPIFPVLAKGDQISAVPLALSSYQFADIRDDRFQSGMDKLVTAIRRAISLKG